jgi:hypothetical protein
LSSLPEESLSGGVTTIASEINLPMIGNSAGDMIYVQDVKALYVWDGIEWDRVYSGADETLSWTTEPLSSYNLSIAGSNTTVTTIAVDPEGFPVSYSYDTNPSNPVQVTTILNNSDGSFTLTPSLDSADAGQFTLRIRADDGLHVSSRSTTVSLQFPVFIPLSGGTGGGSGASSYTAPNGTVVTVSDAVYSSSNYAIGYLFNGIKVDAANAYYLGGGAESGNITLNFTNTNIGVLSEVKVWPYCRSDSFSNITSIQTSSNGTSWTTLYGNQGLNSSNTPNGTSYTYSLNNTTDKYLRFNLFRTGMWGLSMNEIEIYGTTPL